MTNDFAEIDINEEEYWDNEGAICPYCGFINKGDCENQEFYEDGDHIYTCDYCQDTSFSVLKVLAKGNSASQTQN